jgi:Uma2 family endonuclease
MSLVETTAEVEYPESDGQPVGETDLHIEWVFRLRNMLKRHYRGQRIYAAANMLMYFQKGAPYRCVCPDVFVVKDSDPMFRRTYKVWEEGQAPHVVIEVTSRSTKRQDEVHKPGIYAEIGVREYFLYDPSSEYLIPPLQGHRLVGSHYQPIEPDVDGRLYCEQLGLRLWREDHDLVIEDAQTGTRLLTGEEAERAAVSAERAAKEAERAARLAAEAELEKLRDQLRRE